MSEDSNDSDDSVEFVIDLIKKNYNSIFIDQWYPETISRISKYFDMASTCIIGTRDNNEDTFNFNISDEHKYPSYFGIYDGHYGEKCSKFLERNFIKSINPSDFENDEKIKEYFLKMDNDFYNDNEKKNRSYYNNEGSTCTIVQTQKIKKVIKITCANVGDSLSFVSFVKDKQRYIKELCVEHHYQNEIEKERISKVLGFDYTGDRFLGLNLSRAFGNQCKKELKDCERYGEYNGLITVEPSICHVEINENKKEFQFIVIASDGLWNMKTINEVNQFVLDRLEEQKNKTYYEKRIERYKKYFNERKFKSRKVLTNVMKHFVKERKLYKDKYDLESIAEELAHFSYFSKREDNITITIILFK